MISGAAGAMAVVIKDLMADSGPLSDYSKGDRFNHLLMTVLVCGILQTLCGLLQLKVSQAHLEALYGRVYEWLRYRYFLRAVRSF